MLVGEGRDGLLPNREHCHRLALDLPEPPYDARIMWGCEGAGEGTAISISFIPAVQTDSHEVRRGGAFWPGNGPGNRRLWAGGVLLQFDEGRRSINLRVGQLA